MWAYLVGAWLLTISMVFAVYRRDLRAIWLEPVQRYPVLIIESDDWGAGPVEAQATALNGLTDVLTRYRDCTGRHPVMTLALVLAVPDGQAILRDGRYHRITLESPMFAALLEAIERGRTAGVFDLQLHGLEHYWPEALMASDDPMVRRWLTSDGPATTEALPAHLQSRWADASVLPSRPLEGSDVARAVAEEVELFANIFGERPRVAVPPTFVWTETVERTWAEQGIQFVVTPGLRSACRNALGLPDCDSVPLRNGETGTGVTYVVRDDYFEPERGHKSEDALKALARKWAEGRPCLLETHRCNFVGDTSMAKRGMEEVARLHAMACDRYPALRFLSTEELGGILQRKSPEWLDQRYSRRLVTWVARARAHGRFWRAARMTGMAWPMLWLAVLARAALRNTVDTA